jgi:hypothetical protein
MILRIILSIRQVVFSLAHLKQNAPRSYESRPYAVLRIFILLLACAAGTTNRGPGFRKRRECSGRDWVRLSTGRHSLDL